MPYQANIGDRGPTGDLQNPRNEEAVAREVFGPLLGGDLFCVPDPPDFVLCRDGRIVGWAEVTTAVDGERLALANWLRTNGASFAFDALSRDWWVTFKRTAKLGNLDRDRLVEMLRGQEEKYPDELRAVYDRPWETEGDWPDFYRFGIDFACRLHR